MSPYRYLFATLLAVFAGPVASQDYRIAPTPEWVAPVRAATRFEVPTGQLSDGAYYLLGDYQARVGSGSREHFRHFAVKAVNENGVDAIANLEIEFDPSHQALTLHRLDVIRDGRVIPKLAGVQVRVLQREKELEYRIYDGSKTASVFLEDIRVGDIVEYAYSISGVNPVFGGIEFGSFPLQWTIPLHRLHARLLLPAASPARVATRNTEARPRERRLGGYREYVWDREAVPALVVDSDAPGWYDPYAVAEWSEFADWNAVARWAEPLYRVPALAPALSAEVQRIASAHADPESRLLAVLRLVQSQVRYLGVEIGPGSHAPSPPEVVFARRFGDCKDKALLTATLLHALGIEARPALVNTDRVRGVAELPPSPGAFNHVIVQVRLSERRVWLDPTRPVQTGRLDAVFQPDFGVALVVDAATRELTAMARKPEVVPKRTVHAVLDARGGFDRPALYTVTTTTEGAGAESLRDTLASTSLADLQKKYLNYYAAYYADLAVAKAMEIRDDAQANRITVVEHYRVPEFWPHSKEEGRIEASIHVPDMQDYLRAPATTQRQSPITHGHPVDFTQTTEVLLPEEWPDASEDIRVEDPAFVFERKTRGSGEKLTFTDHYRSLVDYVPAEAAPRYAANLDKAREQVGYSLYRYDEMPAASLLERFNWTLAMIAVLLTLAFIWIARRLYRYDPPPGTFVPDPALTGFGGWLLLPAIGVVLTPVVVLATLIEILPALAAPEWRELTDPDGAAYHALWAPALLWALSANLAHLVFATALIGLFFQRRRSLPRAFIAVNAAALAALAIDQWLSMQIPAAAETPEVQKGYVDLGRSLFQLLLWGSYFSLSRRVKSTFTRAWGQPLPRPSPPGGEPQPA